MLIPCPGHREYMRAASCFPWCRKRMRALSHVGGLVRVSLPKRTHQPVLFPLLKSPSYTSQQKACVASWNQEISRGVLATAASEVSARSGQVYGCALHHAVAPRHSSGVTMPLDNLGAETAVLSDTRALYRLKCTIAVPHPTPCTQTFWTPGMSGAMSVSDTIIAAVNDSSFPSPAR
jgi:hypothetical protein